MKSCYDNENDFILFKGSSQITENPFTLWQIVNKLSFELTKFYYAMK